MSRRSKSKTKKSSPFDSYFQDQDEEIVVQDPKITKVFSRDINTYDEKEAFCVMLSKHAQTYEQFESMLWVMSAIQDELLTGQIRRALADTRGFYEISSSYRDMNEDDKEFIIAQAKERRTRNFYAASRKEAWNEGSPAISIGTDPINKPDVEDCSEPIQLALEDMQNVVQNSYQSKKSEMKNAINSVVKCAPVREVREIQTEKQKEIFMNKLLDEFDEGKVTIKMRPDKFSPSKEAGASLPHTMESKDWLACQTSCWVSEQYGDDFMVAFRDNDAMDVRRYEGDTGDYMIFSDDSNSAFELKTHPAIYCNDFDDDDKWKWRGDQDIVLAKVNLAMKDNHQTKQSQAERASLFQIEQKARALQYVDTDSRIKFGRDLKYFGQIPNDLSEALGGKKYMLKVYKRGFSTSLEVSDNSDYIHLVSLATAKMFGVDQYYAIMYPDLNSTLLVPRQIWELSRWNQSSRTRDNPYKSIFGMQVLESKIKDFHLYMTLYFMSHTRNMFRSWRTGKAYLFDEHNKRLLRNLKTKVENHDKLFGESLQGDTNTRFGVVRILSSMVPGAIRGLWICPKSSKQGKASIKVMKAKAGLSNQMALYSEMEYLPDELDDVTYDDWFQESSSIEEDPEFQFYSNSESDDFQSLQSSSNDGHDDWGDDGGGAPSNITKVEPEGGGSESDFHGEDDPDEEDLESKDVFED
jgi:hypothetical protein